VETNSSLGNYLQQSLDSPSTTSEGKHLPPFPAEQQGNINYDDHTTHNHRRHNLPYDQTKSPGVITALQTVIPTHESYLDTNKDRKKRVHPSSSSSSSSSPASTGSLQMSLNTLLSQMNSYSKMKIFEHKMKQYDLSHSGYINKSEFISSLTRSGIHLTAEQAHVIFESHAQQPQHNEGKRGGGIGNNSNNNNYSTSLKLSDHDMRAIPISEFMNKLQTRISTPALQNKFLKDHPSSSSPSSAAAHVVITPLQKNDLVNWKKLVNTLNSKQLDTKRSLELFKEIQIHHQNLISPDVFLKELHLLGVPLNEIEYRNLISNVKKSSNGKLDMTDFTTQLHRYKESFDKQDEMVALMPSLEHTPETLPRHAEVMKRIEKQCQSSNEITSMKRYIQQKKHFHQPTTGLLSSSQTAGTGIGGGGEVQQKNMKTKRNEYFEIFQQTSSSHHPPTHHPPHQPASTSHGIPTCLLNGNSSDTKRERLRWSKMKDLIVNKRNDLLKVFGESSSAAGGGAAGTGAGGDGDGGVSSSHHRLQKAYTPTQIRDKFSQVGIQLGDEDYKLFHSYVLQNTSQTHTQPHLSSVSSASASATGSKTSEENRNSLNFEQICDSLGVSVHTDTTRRARKFSLLLSPFTSLPFPSPVVLFDICVCVVLLV
jgi:Ca2+-binding EF-hand superfamily protein